MAFVPLKVGEPANDLLKLNYLFNKADREIRTPSDIRFARMWHSDALVISGPAIAHGNDDVFPYGGYWQNHPLAANGNKFRQFFAINAGTYDFIIMCNKYNSAPFVQWELDGDIIGSIDLYNATELDKEIEIIPNVVIATDGEHELIGETKNKNASSVGYTVRLYKYCFREA